MSEFTNWMQDARTKKPTQIDFSYDKWIKESEKFTLEEDDVKLFRATEYTSRKLKEIRDKMSLLHSDNFPKNYDYSRAIKDIISVSNSRLMLSMMATQHAVHEHKNILTSHSEHLGMSNEESSHACVDSVNSAIDFCLYYAKKTNHRSKKPINRHEFIQELCYLSGCYGSIESHYNGVLYGMYDFIENDNNIIFEEKNNNFSQSSHECQYRKTIYIHSEIMQNRFDTISNQSLNIKELIATKVGKTRRFKVQNSTSENKVDFYFYMVNLIKTFHQFKDTSVIEKTSQHGFTTKEIIMVYSHLILLAKNIFQHKFNEVIHLNTPYNERSFPSEFSIDDLCIALKETCDIEPSKINKIISFLTYDGNKLKDLWAFPLLKTNQNKISLLIGALAAPMPARTVECWLKYLTVNFTSKGSHFEVEVVNTLKEVLHNNTKVKKEDVTILSNILVKHNNIDEEIDLLIKIDDCILIIDLKSIISLDSPVSMHNSINRVDHGTEQVKRQIEFIKNNAEYFENLTKIKILPNCIFYPYILSSNYALTGCAINNVPVIDKDILFNYFSGQDLEMLHAEGKSYAHLHLYKNKEEMKNNIDIYFRNPIETTNNFDLYRYVETPATYENDVIIRRLIRSDMSNMEAIDKLKRYKEFEISFSNEITEITDSMIFSLL